MRRALLAVTAVIPLLSACLPFSIASGSLGQSLLPWTFRTQYAFTDAKKFKDENGRKLVVERPDAEGGEVLRIRLFGFMFNASDDRRTWGASEWRHYYQGVETQPFIGIEVVRVNKMKDGDEVEMDTENPPAATLEDPVLDIDYSPGTGTLTNQSEYPDELKQLGSRRKGKVKLDSISTEPGPLAIVRGTVELEISKGPNDPDGVVEGDFSVQFSAQVLGERLAECNEGTSAFGTFGDACSDYDL